jgi:hypothetical protein
MASSISVDTITTKTTPQQTIFSVDPSTNVAALNSDIIPARSQDARAYALIAGSTASKLHNLSHSVASGVHTFVFLSVPAGPPNDDFVIVATRLTSGTESTPGAGGSTAGTVSINNPSSGPGLPRRFNVLENSLGAQFSTAGVSVSVFWDE